MKKSLSVVLSSALVLSMFGAVAANADEMTAQQKFDALKDKGIFAGVNANGDAGLNQTMTRAEFARIAGLLDGLNVDATPASQTFKDVAPGNWAYEEIEAAAEAKLIQGYGNGIYNPKGDVKVEDMAIVLDKILGLQVDDAAKVDGADAYAQKYVKAAIDAGILSADTNFKAAATREQLVDSSYETYAQANQPAQSVTDVKAIGASKIEVDFASAVDTAAVKATVKKGTIPVNVKSVTFADDKKSATIELITKMTKGDYTVSVTGLTSDAIAKTVSVEDEKVSKIDIVGDKAPIDRTNADEVHAWIKIYNQYNEDVTTNYIGQATITAGGYSIANIGSNGDITIKNASGNFIVDTKVAVSVVHASSQTFASKVLDVALAAKADQISNVKVYNKDSKTLATDSTYGDFYVIADVKDQYGNAVTDLNALRDDLIVQSSNTSVVDTVKDAVYTDETKWVNVTVDGKTETAIQLKAPASKIAGTSTIYMISKTTGGRASVDVQVKDVAKVDSLTLSSPELAVAGEKIEIPFTAVDQFGAQLNSADALNAGMMSDLTVSGDANLTASDIAFEQDYVNNKAKLVLDTSALTGTKALTASKQLYINGVTSTGKPVSLTITLQPNATPVVVSGVENLKGAVAIGGTTTISRDKIDVLDQYNRSKHASDFAGYSVQLSLDNADVTATQTTIDGTNTSSDITGAVEGTSTVTLKLVDGAGKEVANSSANVSVQVVKQSAITSYDVAAIPTLYAGGSTYAKDLTVTGKLSDGTVVAVPVSSDYYSVTNSVYADGLINSGGKIYANGTLATTWDPNTTKTYSITVVGFTSTGTTYSQQEVKVSNEAPHADVVEVRSNNDVVKESDAVVSISASKLPATKEDLANDAFKVTDQYGFEITTLADKFANVYANNFSDSTVTSYSTGIKEGTSFTLTVVTPNGKAMNVKVVVTK